MVGFTPEQPSAELGRASYTLLRAASNKSHIAIPEIFFPISRYSQSDGEEKASYNSTKINLQ